MTQPDGTGGPDGFPEIFFARRSLLDPLQESFLTNDGTGHFTDRTSLLVDDHVDSTIDIALCDLDGQPGPEFLAGNGESGNDVVRKSWQPQPNRMFSRDVLTGEWTDKAAEEGFKFVSGMTASVECGDIDGDGVVDLVLFGNTGERNQLYQPQMP